MTIRVRRGMLSIIVEGHVPRKHLSISELRSHVRDSSTLARPCREKGARESDSRAPYVFILNPPRRRGARLRQHLDVEVELVSAGGLDAEQEMDVDALPVGERCGQHHRARRECGVEAAAFGPREGGVRGRRAARHVPSFADTRRHPDRRFRASGTRSADGRIYKRTWLSRINWP